MARRSDHTRDELYEMALDAAGTLADREGLRGVTARGVARNIGYTVGTVYNLFEDLDDLLRHLNGRTMDSLYQHVTAEPLADDPVQALRTLARRYCEFVAKHPRRWAAVIEYSPHEHAIPDWYRHKAQRLVALGEAAIAKLFRPGETAVRRRHGHVLWSALFGLTSLAQANSLPEGETIETLIDSLVETYVVGLKARRAEG